MRISDVRPLEKLKTILEQSGLGDTIYISKAPTSGLPDTYVILHMNGAIRTNMSMMGMVGGSILIEINVRLMSNGQRNNKKHEIIIGKFDSLFENNKKIESGGYVFGLNPNTMLYSGGGISEGFTSDLINLTFNKI